MSKPAPEQLYRAVCYAFADGEILGTLDGVPKSDMPLVVRVFSRAIRSTNAARVAAGRDQLVWAVRWEPHTPAEMERIRRQEARHAMMGEE